MSLYKLPKVHKNLWLSCCCFLNNDLLNCFLVKQRNIVSIASYKL